MRHTVVLLAAVLLAGCPPTPTDSCFVAGTPVATPSGPISIEQLQVGDVVLSYDHHRGVVVEGRVVHTHQHAAQPTLHLTAPDGISLGVTHNHPIYSPAKGAYVSAGSVDDDDRFVRLGAGNTTEQSIWSSTTTAATADVFNITVEPDHNYFAGGVLVHNKDPEPDPEDPCVVAARDVMQETRQALPPEAFSCVVDEDCVLWPKLDVCTDNRSLCFDGLSGQAVAQRYVDDVPAAAADAGSVVQLCSRVHIEGCLPGSCWNDVPTGVAFCVDGVCGSRLPLEPSADAGRTDVDGGS